MKPRRLENTVKCLLNVARWKLAVVIFYRLVLTVSDIFLPEKKIVNSDSMGILMYCIYCKKTPLKKSVTTHWWDISNFCCILTIDPTKNITVRAKPTAALIICEKKFRVEFYIGDSMYCMIIIKWKFLYCGFPLVSMTPHDNNNIIADLATCWDSCPEIGLLR